MLSRQTIVNLIKLTLLTASLMVSLSLSSTVEDNDRRTKSPQKEKNSSAHQPKEF